MRLVRDAHEPDRPFERPEHGEERLRLADGAAQVVLRVLDEQGGPDLVGVGQRRQPPVQLRVLPRLGAELHLPEHPAGEIPGQHERREVGHAATGHGRREARIRPDNPVRQVPAVGAAGHPEPRGVGESVVHDRVHVGQHVARRAHRPVGDVRGVEVLAVALRAARVRREDAHAGSGQHLELPVRRPPVQRVRAAVDLEHERRGVAGGRG